MSSAKCASSIPSGGGQDLLDMTHAEASTALELGCSQEAAYNMGRAAHQLGLNHIASHCYTKALLLSTSGMSSCGGGHAGTEFPDPSPRREIDSESVRGTGSSRETASVSAVDKGMGSPAEFTKGPLSPEAAHNLAMIYASSGSGDLAREVYRSFLVF